MYLLVLAAGSKSLENTFHDTQVEVCHVDNTNSATLQKRRTVVISECDHEVRKAWEVVAFYCDRDRKIVLYHRPSSHHACCGAYASACWCDCLSVSERRTHAWRGGYGSHLRHRCRMAATSEVAGKGSETCRRKSWRNRWNQLNCTI